MGLLPTIGTILCWSMVVSPTGTAIITSAHKKSKKKPKRRVRLELAQVVDPGAKEPTVLGLNPL